MTAVYVYCIVKAPRTPSLTRTPEGLPGASRPRAVRVTPSLWLIAADVPLDTYGGEALERALSDLDWVGRIALAHEAVVEDLSKRRGVTVIPMKLFTMFSTADRAIADITRRRAAITAVMRRIAGAEEWGVRVSRPESVPAAPAPEGTARASGRAFLAAKKAARDATRNARAAAAAAAADAYDALSRMARASKRRDDVPPSAATPPLLDAAFLVPVDRRATFTRAARRAAARVAEAGGQMTLSGPWPAYNFVNGERG